MQCLLTLHMKQEKLQNKQLPEPSVLSRTIFWFLSVGTALFLGVGFFYWTIVPYMQSYSYIIDTRQAYSTADFSIFIDDEFVFEPDSNVQGILRSDFLRQIMTQYSNGTFKTLNPIFDKAINEMETYVSSHKNYYTYVIGLANAYSIKYGLDNDPKSLALEEKYFKQAMEIIPGRQDVVYAYSLVLLKQNRHQEALDLVQQLITKNPDIYSNYYQLGQLKMMMGIDHYTEALAQFEIALSHNVNTNPDFTKNVYQELLKYYYEKKDVPNFVIVTNQLIKVDPAQKNAYVGVLDFIKVNGNKLPNLNIGKPASK
jgi:tetratricopeptide (TPR) repeat protein